jgi:hypothetical protein
MIQWKEKPICKKWGKKRVCGTDSETRRKKKKKDSKNEICVEIGFCFSQQTKTRRVDCGNEDKKGRAVGRIGRR